MRNFSKKEITNYNDEDKFTLDVVIPLFESLADFNDLHKDGCGVWYWGKDKRREGQHGIDVLFGYHDILGSIKHTAVLCKTIKVSMGVRSSKKSSFLTIETQIKLAWDSIFISPLSRKPSGINDLILLTNKDIVGAVWDHSWNLERSRHRNTYLWDINKLYSVVKKLCKVHQRKT